MTSIRLLNTLLVAMSCTLGVLTAQDSAAQDSDTRAASAPAPARSPVEDSELGETRNVHVCGSLFLAGQPTQEDVRLMKEKGIARVISLRQDGEIDWDEGSDVRDAGIEFIEVPFRSPESLTNDVFDKVRALLRGTEQTPTLLHCGSANRVAAVWLAHRVLDQGVPLSEALEEARTIGLSNPGYEAKVRRYVRKQQRKPSVRPGINDRFLVSDASIDEWLGRFEVESREVFTARHQVLKAAGVGAGSRVADIGAGTGLFTRLFSEAAGAKGWVFSIDISPHFADHIRNRAQDDELSNVSVVLCPDDSISLPRESIDIAFICDTYHHFEYPASTLASIRHALRPGGTLILLDFERIPGTSREFILNHVRAGKEDFRREVEAAGFVFNGEVPIEELQENYLLRFQKR